jgi:hypothetical protein
LLLYIPFIPYLTEGDFPVEKLKIIATLEKRDMKDILSELVEEYIIGRHKETLEILSNPKWVEMIKQGKREVEEG